MIEPTEKRIRGGSTPGSRPRLLGVERKRAMRVLMIWISVSLMLALYALWYFFSHLAK